MARLPDEARRRLEAPYIWHIATVMEDGSPQVTPVWADVSGDQILVNTAIGRRKEKNVRRDPRVAMSMVDPENTDSQVHIRGRVVEFVEGDAALENVNALAKKYHGFDEYPWLAPGEKRVIFKIEPTAVVTV